MINRENALGISRNTCLRVDDALAHLHFLQQGLVVNFLVAFDIDNIDQRIFRNCNNERAALAFNRYITEQAGLEQRLDRGINCLIAELLAAVQLHVGEDGFILDALIAVDHNVVHSRSHSRTRKKGWRSHGQHAKDQRQNQTKYKSHTHQIATLVTPGAAPRSKSGHASSFNQNGPTCK